MKDSNSGTRSIRSLIQVGARLAWYPGIRRALGSPTGVPVGRAIQNALSPPAADEAGWFVRIEHERSSLAQIAERVEVTDYGAGASAGRAGGKDAAVAERVVELGPFYRISHVDALSSRVLFSLARSLKPNNVVELGTCTGLSAAYLSAAMELNDGGRLVTIEGAPTLAARAGETLAKLGLRHRVEVRCGSFADQLPQVCRELMSIDLLFNDGHHLEEPTIAYFETALPYLAPNAVVVLDDISWSRGMRSAWRRLRKHPRVATSINLWRLGVLALGDRGVV